MNDKKLGQILIESEIITEMQLTQALEVQKKTKSRLGQILTAQGVLSVNDLAEALSKKFNLEFVELVKNPPGKAIFNLSDTSLYIKYQYMPIKQSDSQITFALSSPSHEVMSFLKGHYNQSISFVITPKEQLFYFIHLFAEDHLSHQSVYALAEAFPDYSAGKVFTRKQLWFFFVCYSLLLLFFCSFPSSFLFFSNIFITLFLLFSFGFKFLLTWVGSHPDVDTLISDDEVATLKNSELPVYSILVPMYKEWAVLPHLTKSLESLDYPKEKLDIKIILEADDLETIKVARDLKLPSIFEIIIVPHSLPKTKPKACNYAMNFIRGEFATIYDAEDRPERDQLKKALVCFKKSSSNTAVVQAKLNYFNPSENWITKLFTMEYSLWFDFFLPALSRLKVPIPLGGTSNHFRTDVLKGVGAWDPFNVTEDADLGIRLYQLGYNIEVINSTTFEEANTRVGNWIRQRSRWIKGYMQTYLVHMRTPVKLYKTLGFKGFLSVQFFIGGTFLTALITPYINLIFLIWFFTRTHYFDPMFSPGLLYLGTLNLLVGNAFFIYIQMIGVFKRKLFDLIPYSLLTPIYWIMFSIAGYKALYQLIVNPFYWEKTEHGLSEQLNEIN